jgi:CBS domain-containing protein
MKVENCMCNDVYTVTPNSTIQDCAKLMCNNHIGCIPVCDNSQNIVGLVTDRDIILRGIACDKDIKTTPVSDIMTCKVCCCNGDCDVTEAEKIMSNYQIRRLPVVDNNNKLIGIITLGNLVQNQNVSSKGVDDTLENICKCNGKNAE